MAAKNCPAVLAYFPQAVMDAAHQEMEWACSEETRLKKSAVSKGPPSPSSTRRGFAEVSGCVAEGGAGAWG